LYSASSSPLLLRGVSGYSIDTVSELTYRSAILATVGEGLAQGPYMAAIQWDSSLQPSGRKTPNLPQASGARCPRCHFRVDIKVVVSFALLQIIILRRYV